jgi:hypothetical protein
VKCEGCVGVWLSAAQMKTAKGVNKWGVFLSFTKRSADVPRNAQHNAFIQRHAKDALSFILIPLISQKENTLRRGLCINEAQQMTMVPKKRSIIVN